MRESAFAAQSIEDVHLRHQLAAGDHEIGHVGSIRGQISRRATHRQEFTKARPRILEAVAESSQAEAECGRRIRDHLAICRTEAATFQQARISDPFEDHRLSRSTLHDFERSGRR